MADISSRQNDPATIQLLQAQRHLYRRAKRLSAVQVVLAAGTPIVAATAIALNPNAATWAALGGIVVALLDVGLLDPSQQGLREIAASVQEEFDCQVLQLAWNEAVAGPRPAAEDIHEAAAADISRPVGPLENWYPPAVAPLPLYQGRLICQRTNCWWDSKLRRRYAVGIVIAACVISLFVLVVGVANGMTLEKFVLAVVAPLLPAMLWAMREVRRQHAAASALDRLKDYGTSLWGRVIENAVSEVEVNRLSRELQDAIFYRRRENPFVFDWIYRRLRKRYEEQMNVGAEKMVSELGTRR